MRKLLLTSSALVAAASISSYAVADVSVSGEFEWTYTQQAADLDANDGDSFATDNEIVISFTNKTDNGLTVTGKLEMDADDGDESAVSVDESVLSTKTLNDFENNYELEEKNMFKERFWKMSSNINQNVNIDKNLELKNSEGWGFFFYEAPTLFNRESYINLRNILK